MENVQEEEKEEEEDTENKEEIQAQGGLREGGDDDLGMYGWGYEDLALAMENVQEEEVKEKEEEEEEKDMEKEEEEEEIQVQGGLREGGNDSLGVYGWRYEDLTLASPTLDLNPAGGLLDKTIILSSTLNTPDLNISHLSLPLYDSQTGDLAHVASCSVDSHFSCNQCNRFVSPSHECQQSQIFDSPSFLFTPSQDFQLHFPNVEAVVDYLKE